MRRCRSRTARTEPFGAALCAPGDLNGDGTPDIIVNNAGVTRRAYIMDLTEEDWDRIHRVNAKGVFFCLQRAAQQMMEQGGGCIINIASIAGRILPRMLPGRLRQRCRNFPERSNSVFRTLLGSPESCDSAVA